MNIIFYSPKNNIDTICNTNKVKNNTSSPQKIILKQAIEILEHKDPELIKNLKNLPENLSPKRPYSEVENRAINHILESIESERDSSASLIFQLFQHCGIKRSRNAISCKINEIRTINNFNKNVSDLKKIGLNQEKFFNFRQRNINWPEIADEIINQQSDTNPEILGNLDKIRQKYHSLGQDLSIKQGFSKLETKIFDFFINFCKSKKIEAYSVNLIRSTFKNLGRISPSQTFQKKINDLNNLNVNNSFKDNVTLNQQFASLDHQDNGSKEINNFEVINIEQIENLEVNKMSLDFLLNP